MVINIEEEEEHNIEYHTEVNCIFCNRKYPKNDIIFHQDSCLERNAECRYCTLQLTVREKEEHEYICGAKTEKCEKCNKYVPIKDYDTHHCEEEIYLNKHIDVSNIPVVSKKKVKKVINPGEIASMNKAGILHGKKEPPVKQLDVPIVHPPIVHHKREVVVNKVQSIKVDIPSKKINKPDITQKKPNITDKINIDILDKNKKDNQIKEQLKPIEKKEIKPSGKVDDILKAGLKHKENIQSKSIKPKPVTPHKPIDLNKKITSSPGKLNKEPIIKKMPYKKEIPKPEIKNKSYKQITNNIDINDYQLEVNYLTLGSL
jgi:hypothetical protein